MTNCRSTMTLITTASRSSSRLVRLQRSRTLNVRSCRRQNVQRVRTCLCRNNNGRGLNLSLRGLLRLYLFFNEFRPTIGLTRTRLQGDLLRHLVAFFRVLRICLFILLSRQRSSVSLSTRVGLSTSTLVRANRLVVGLVRYLGQFSTEQRLICCTRIRVTVSNRHRYTKSENNNRRRRVKQVLTLHPRFNSLHRSRPILFISCHCTGTVRDREIFCRNVHTCRCLSVTNNGSIRCLLPFLTLSSTNRRFCPSIRTLRGVTSNLRVLLYRSFNEYRRANLVTIIRDSRRDRRNCRHLTQTCITLGRPVRLSTTTRVNPSLIRRPFLNAHRFRQGVVDMRAIRSISSTVRSMTTMFSSLITHMPWCVGLCMRRLLRLRSCLHLLRFLIKVKVISRPRNNVTKCRVRTISSRIKRYFKREERGTSRITNCPFSTS